MPEKILDRLALAQRARDARRWRGGSSARGPAGAILVTGNGHARSDRGVPATLAQGEPRPAHRRGRHLRGLAGQARAPLYAAEFGKGPLPFDFVVFTPVTERDDPCAALSGHDFSQRKQPSALGAARKRTSPARSPATSHPRGDAGVLLDASS